MDNQLPVGLQIALYLATAAIVAFVAIVLPLLFRFNRQLERVVASVEELKAEAKPLTQETRELVEGLRGLCGTANRLADEVGSVVEPPLLAGRLGVRLLRTGVGTFVKTLWSRDQDRQTKERLV